MIPQKPRFTTTVRVDDEVRKLLGDKGHHDESLNDVIRRLLGIPPLPPALRRRGRPHGAKTAKADGEGQ